MGAGLGMGLGRFWRLGLMSSGTFALLELRILSMENARGFDVSGDG